MATVWSITTWLVHDMGNWDMWPKWKLEFVMLSRLVMTNFVVGNDFFFFCSITHWVWEKCGYACLPGIFNNLLGTTKSMVVILSLLISIVKDQVGSYVYIASN